MATRTRPLSQRPVPADRRLGELRRARITDLAERTLAEGLRLVYHHHNGHDRRVRGRHRRADGGDGPGLSTSCSTPAMPPGAAPTYLSLGRRYHSRISHVRTKDMRRPVRKASNAGDWSFLDTIIEG